MAKYRITGPDGATYEVTAPDDASEQDVLSYAQSQFGGQQQRQPPEAKPDRSAAETALRMANLGAKGFNDSIAETVGGIPDLVARGMRTVGLPAPEEGYYANKLKQGLNWVGQTFERPVYEALGIDTGPQQAEGAVEKAIYGGGRGIGDAASIAVPAAAVANASKAGTLTNRVASVLSSQPGMQVASGAVGGAVGEATDNPLLGTAAAFAVPLAVGAARTAISPVSRNLTAEQRRLVEVAQQEGIPLTPGQQTGSKGLQLTESVFNRLPMTSGPSEAQREVQRQAFNRAVLKRAGIDADNASPEVLAEAQRRLGGLFNDLSSRNAVAVDDELRSALDTIRAQYQRNLTPDIRGIVDAYVDDILNNGDEIAGQTYQKARSAMGLRAKTATDPELSNTLKSLRNALDEAARRSISPDDALAWDAARKQYASLKTIERAMQSGTPTAIAGNIAPTQLQQAVRQGRSDYARGGGDLNDLARLGNAFVRDNIPDSGTAQRNYIQNMLTLGGAGGVGLAAGADPTIMALTAGGVAAPRLAQMLYNTPILQRYLTNDLASRVLPEIPSGTWAAMLLANQKEPALVRQGSRVMDRAARQP